MAPAENKAKRLSFVNHIRKTFIILILIIIFIIITPLKQTFGSKLFVPVCIDVNVLMLAFLSLNEGIPTRIRYNLFMSLFK